MREKRFHEKAFLSTLKEIIGNDGYYNPIPQMMEDTYYNIAWGERSNGKSYGIQAAMLIRYIMYGEKCALFRRWQTDFLTKTASNMFGGIVNSGVIKRLTNGEYDRIFYKSKMFYLAYEDESGNIIKENEPFCYGFALSEMEHDKGGVYPENIGMIMFDEFISRRGYVRDEFGLFLNAISTIARTRDFAKIFMLGNSVSTSCPYFRNMGITHLNKQVKGEISIYKSSDGKPFISCLWADSPTIEKSSNAYFQFNNPKARMITNGEFETSIYPVCPYPYFSSDVKFRFFIDYDGDLLQCNIVKFDDKIFIDINPKTTPLKNPEKDLIYSDKNTGSKNYYKKINRPVLKIQKLINLLFSQEKVFYSDNMTGECVRNYLMYCGLRNALAE